MVSPKLLLTTFLVSFSTSAAAGKSVRLTESKLVEMVNRKTGIELGHAKRQSSLSPGPDAQFFELPLDHFGKGKGTFLNRYYVDDSFYEPGGPVFFLDVGESSAESSASTLNTGSDADLAKRYKGLLVLWEHRFYGVSMPNFTSTFSFDDPEILGQYFKYQSIEQALEDVMVFARNFKQDKYPNQDLAPGSIPWIFIGGSYPGARSAWSRFRNPEIFHASLASSAVVELQAEMWQYYKVIERTMSNGYSNCSADLGAIAQWISDVYNNKNTTAVDSFLQSITGPPGTALYQYLHYSDSTDSTQKWENARANLSPQMQLIFSDYQYWGMKGWLGYTCDALYASGESAKKGLAETYGVDYAVKVFAEIVREIWKQTLTDDDYASSKVKPTKQKVDCTDPKYIAACMESISTNYAWSYQVCSEFGAFHTANKAHMTPLIPDFENVANNIEDCVGWFGKSVASGPNVKPTNDKYGGWNMNPPNVLWTDGELDPWRAITPNSMEDGAPKNPRTITVPNSGETAGDKTFLGYIIKEGLHCSDLRYDPFNTTRGAPTNDVADAVNGHQLFINALDTWLPAYQKHKVEANLGGIGLNGNGGIPKSQPGAADSAANKKKSAASSVYDRNAVIILFSVIASVYYILL